MDQRPNFFAGPYIERRSEERDDPQWLAAARADPATRYLIARGTEQLMQTGTEPRIAFLANGAPLDVGTCEVIRWIALHRCRPHSFGNGGRF